MTENNSAAEPTVATATDEPTGSVSFSDLFAGDSTTEREVMEDTLKAAPIGKFESAIEKVDPKKEMAVKSTTEPHFRFRELLDEKELAELKAGAPVLASSFTKDINEIMNFASPTKQKIKDFSVKVLQSQRDIEVPEADKIMSDFLRDLDGFQKKYRNKRFEQVGKKILGLFSSAKYTVKTMKRDMLPIERKMDEAEIKIMEADDRLRENVIRSQQLVAETLGQMKDVSKVLAALEEIIDNLRARYEAADALAVSARAKGESSVSFEGETITIDELEQKAADYALSLRETEKTWHDWRQIFFNGWVNAPSLRNSMVASFGLRRQLNAFKEMGLPQGRMALAKWKQGVEARQQAEIGMKVQEVNELMITMASEEMVNSTRTVAEASQTQIMSEETIHKLIDGVRQQARAIVEADRAGRERQARTLKKIEQGEVDIRNEVIEMQAKLAENARQDRALAPGASGGPKAISTKSSGEGFLGGI